MSRHICTSKDYSSFPGISLCMYVSLCKGKYEIFAAVTHQGRSADSGHYVGYMKDTVRRQCVDSTPGSVCIEKNDIF